MIRQSDYITLKEDKPDNYSAFILAGPLHLNGGDSISYRIVAVDTALVPNTEFCLDTAIL